MAGLRGIPVPEEATAAWHRMCDDLTERDMAPEMDADPALASCIRRKRPDGWAVHWGRRRVRILEFTRCNDYRSDWREETEAYKTARYQPLRDRMLAALPNGCSVEIINFTLGIRGSAGVCRDAVDGGTDGTRGPGDESAAPHDRPGYTMPD